jgi:O-acetyl-ADP-ribose deacetylase (regulator of RNase III)
MKTVTHFTITNTLSQYMLKEYKGDLLELFEQKQFDIIIHQMNCMNNMGSGIALAIAQKYPQTKE